MCYDHSGLVSTEGPLGSQHSLHTTLKGSRACPRVKKKKKLHVDKHLCLLVFSYDQRVCACFIYGCWKVEVEYSI